jgi:hypothetical protein
MATPNVPSLAKSLSLNQDALAIAAQARALPGNKLEQLVVRLQRKTGQSKAACWRFVIQHGLNVQPSLRRWTEEEFETLREGLVKSSLNEIAKKLHRSPKALRDKLKREGYSLREIRCDIFSVHSLASAVRVPRSQVLFWIERGWLPATVTRCGKATQYTITPDGLTHLLKSHLQDLLRIGLPNQSLFEAYVQYCYAPKHTVGEQLLNVRRDKRERAAFEQSQRQNASAEEENLDTEQEKDTEPEDRYRIVV